MKILFISHTYPPIRGGVETQNFEIFSWLSKTEDVKLIANKKRWLIPFFFGYAAIRVLFEARKYDVVLLGSCILAPIGWLIKKTGRTPVISIAHGLDLNWNNPLYQFFWPKFFVPVLDKLIAVGNETIAVGTARNIPEEKFVFIPNGIEIEKFFKPHSTVELEEIINEKLNGRKVILSTGRLAKHKGLDWFCEKILPSLPDDIIFLIAGDGEKRSDIEKIIKEKKLQSKAKMLGRVNDQELEVLYNTADIYVKPNIKVEGTMEGFGIVVIEAASCKLPVVATDLEGLKDAIKDNQNGFLIEPGDAQGFVDKIKQLLDDERFRKEFGEKARQFILENYQWKNISQKYIEEISKVLQKNK